MFCSKFKVYDVGDVRRGREPTHLISTLKASFCCFASRLHSIDEDAETFLLTSEKAECQWRVPGWLG